MNNPQNNTLVKILLLVVIILLVFLIKISLEKKSSDTYVPEKNIDNQLQKENDVSIEDVPQKDVAVQNSNIKTYTNSKYGFSLKYPSNATIKNTTTGDGSQIINFIVPFDVKYEKFNSKSFYFFVNSGSCSNYFQGTYEKVTVNGITYNYSSPEWTATSGMSTISNFKKYFIERDSSCIVFNEYITGTGTNETPPGATAPADIGAYFDSEMKSLDRIMATVTFK